MSHEPLLFQVQIQQISLGEVGCCDASQRSILKVPFHRFPWPKERVKSTWKASAFLSFCPWNLKLIHCFLDYYCIRPVERHFRNKRSNRIRTPTLESEFWLNFLIFDLRQSLSTLNPSFFAYKMRINNIDLMRQIWELTKSIWKTVGIKSTLNYFYLPFLFLLEGGWSIGVSIEEEGKQTVKPLMSLTSNTARCSSVISIWVLLQLGLGSSSAPALAQEFPPLENLCYPLPCWVSGLPK